MEKQSSSCMEIILAAIENGTLPPRETEARLNELIDQEIARKDSPASMEIISAAQMLLWELHTHGSMPFESHAPEIREKVSGRYTCWKRLQKALKITSHLALVSCLLVLVVLAARHPFSVSWITQESINNGEQYVVKGNKFEFDLSQAASAEQRSDGESIIILSRDEYAKYLGFTPDVPERYGFWTLFRSTVSVTTQKDSLTLSYRHDDGRTIHTTIWYYHDDEIAAERRSFYDALPPCEACGMQFSITSDTKKMSSVAWHDGDMIVTTGGSIPFDELVEAAAMFRREGRLQ